jgi:dTDP-glucose pyrophosphorylase
LQKGENKLPNYKVFQDFADALRTKIFGVDSNNNTRPIRTDSSGRLEVQSTISGPVEVSGVVGVSGSVAVSGPVEVSGVVGVSGSVAISGPVEVSGVVGVSGSVAISGPVEVSGVVGVSGSVAVSGPVEVSGVVGVSGSVAISGPVEVSGVVGVSGSVAVSGPVEVSGVVGVSGSVAISGPVEVSGVVGVSGSVAVSGPVEVSGVVGISGSVAVSGPVEVSGVVGVSGSVAISGPVEVSGVVGVSGSVAISGPVEVSGVVGVSGSVAVSGPVEVSVVGMEVAQSFFIPPQHDNLVILMAGGLGQRLKPLTENCPKPLLKVGGKVLLETILENFISEGFNKFYISVNYRAQMIMDYFGDGSRWGVSIQYLQEDKPLGTAGALALLPAKPREPFMVMNADILTKINMAKLLEFHKEKQGIATICVKEHHKEIPYGIVAFEENHLQHIEEKPVQRFFINAGIYVLNPEVLDYIPLQSFFDIPDLIKKLLEEGKVIKVFPIREYWIDIGRLDEYERANHEFNEVFA